MLIDILTPVLARPQNVEPLYTSLGASVLAEQKQDIAVSLTFICSPEDQGEIDAVVGAGFEPLVMPAPRAPADYSVKINTAARASDGDFFFLGADDLRFHPGWLSKCLALHNVTGALVIGTNDLGNPMVKLGMHATHSLVHRDYLAHGTIDEPGKLLHEGYAHNACDVEFVETAMWRRTWAFAREAHVEHLHPIWRKGTSDATYKLGQIGYAEDLAHLRSRWDLWNHREVRLMMARGRRQTLPGGRREIRLR